MFHVEQTPIPKTSDSNPYLQLTPNLQRIDTAIIFFITYVRSGNPAPHRYNPPSLLGKGISMPYTLSPMQPETLPPELGGAPAEAGESNRWTLNFGPQHPATHTTLRLVLELDGE